MNKQIIERVIKESEYILATTDTIREIAKIFMVSKSTVHKDLSTRLLEIDEVTYQKVAEILNYHIDVRHLRGGESTKRKYLSKKTN